MNKLALAAALACAAPLSAQVVDLGNACSGTFVAPVLAGTIVGSTVTVDMTSPGAPYSPFSFGMFAIGFANLSAPLPCGCTLVPSLDVLEIGSFFNAPSPIVPAQLVINVPVGVTGASLYFQGLEFFVPGSSTGIGCTFLGLEFNTTNALQVILP